jgi:hypothetical protein
MERPRSFAIGWCLGTVVGYAMGAVALFVWWILSGRTAALATAAISIACAGISYILYIGQVERERGRANG